MKNKIKRIFNLCVDYLMPPDIKCIFCGEEIEQKNPFHACQHCLNTLPYNNQKICKICGGKTIDLSDVCLSCFHRPPPYNIARSPFLYEQPISNLVSKIKFKNAKYLVKPLAEFMALEYKRNNFAPDIIIPVPLSPNRHKKRTYNQAELLAAELSSKFNVPMNTNLATRIRNTAPQANLAWKERQKNMIDAFQVLDKKKLKNKTVLVIDDVLTTGATINSLCHEIQKARPKKILVLTLAHTYIDRIRTKNQNLIYKLQKTLKIFAINSAKKLKIKLKKFKKN